AFTHGRAVGVQFHPELTPSVLECWLDTGGAANLAGQGIDPAGLMAQTQALPTASPPPPHELARRFVTDVARPPRRPASPPPPGLPRGGECDRSHTWHVIRRAGWAASVVRCPTRSSRRSPSSARGSPRAPSTRSSAPAR